MHACLTGVAHVSQPFIWLRIFHGGTAILPFRVPVPCHQALQSPVMLGRAVLSDEFCAVTRAGYAVHALLDCVVTGAERSLPARCLLWNLGSKHTVRCFGDGIWKGSSCLPEEMGCNCNPEEVTGPIHRPCCWQRKWADFLRMRQGP
jgi:hypothetical protein